MHVIEKNAPVSRSAIWAMQQNYYDSAGPKAWAEEMVPQGSTSNCYTADMYAAVTAAFFQDLLDNEDDRVPLILEIGAGSGRFAWQFINRLRNYHLQDDLEDFPFEYLITDGMPANVEIWQTRRRFQRLADQGVLNFGQLALSKDISIKTADGKTLSRDDLAGRPVIVIANYFFDSTPADILINKDGKMEQALLTLSTEGEKPNGKALSSWEDIKADFESQPLSGPYSDKAFLNEMVEEYASLDDGTFVSIPTPALEFLENFKDWGAPVLMLAGGLGYGDADEFVDEDPFIFDTYFAFHANYHIIARYMEHIGGQSQFQRHRDPDFISGVFTLPESEDEPLWYTQRQAKLLMREFNPYDAHEMLEMITESVEDASFRQIFALVRFSRFDPVIASACFPILFETMHHTDEEYDQRQLFEIFIECYRSFFPDGSEVTFDVSVAQLFLAAKLDNQALMLIEDSLDEFGPSAKRLYVYALILLRHQRKEEAKTTLEQALKIEPTMGPATRLYEQHFVEKAGPEVKPVPHLTVDSNAPDAFERAKAIYDEHGAVVLDDIFPDQLIQRLKVAFDKRYQDPQAAGLGNPNNVGNKRFTVPLRMQDPFDDPDFFAPKLLIDLLTYTMGVKPIVNAWGSVVTYPGARTQHVHREHPLLFQTDEANADLPTTAVTVLMPLIDLNEELGGTQLWEGTHRLGLEEETQGQPTVVYTKAGSALLFDYRVYHGGMGSTADIVRPTLYISYSQPWFRDTLAYDSHFALGMTKEELDGMDEAHRDMFRFATVLPS